MRSSLFLIPLALSSTACSSGEEFARESGVAEATATATARAEARPSSPAPVSVVRKAQEDGGNWEFTYTWPAAVSAQAVLAAKLARERDSAMAEDRVSWVSERADVPADCFPCRNRSYRKDWKVVATTPNYLSLSARTDTYTGGAHGNYDLQSLVWDKAAQSALSGVQLFQSPAALDAALGTRLCSALNAERTKRRGEPVRPVVAGDTGFSACQKVAEATVLVGSSTGLAFDRIGIWFGPYVAGSYAEGAYELNFPVDAAILRAVKPEFAAAFAIRR